MLRSLCIFPKKILLPITKNVLLNSVKIFMVGLGSSFAERLGVSMTALAMTFSLSKSVR